MTAPATPPATPADRFARMTEGLCRVITAWCANNVAACVEAAPVILLAWTKLRLIAVRFADLAIQLQAGTLRQRPRATSPSASLGTPSRGPEDNPIPRLPRTSGWLLRLVPETAPFGDQLRDFLSDPEVATLLAAAPEMGQMLRPVCRMLGVPEPVLPPPSTPTALSSLAVRDPDAWSLITEHWFRCGPTSGSRRRSAARRPALRQPSSVPRFKPA